MQILFVDNPQYNERNDLLGIQSSMSIVALDTRTELVNYADVPCTERKLRQHPITVV